MQDFNKSKGIQEFTPKPGPNSSLVSGWMFKGMLVGDAGNFLERISGAKCWIVEIYIEKKQPCINMIDSILEIYMLILYNKCYPTWKKQPVLEDLTTKHWFER